VWEKGITCLFLMGKPEGKGCLEDPGRDGRIIPNVMGLAALGVLV
jgi:hypothetical protein